MKYSDKIKCWKHIGSFASIVLIFLLIVFCLIITSCEFDKLGLYTEETDEEAAETTTAAGVLGQYSEEYFYEMKAKQLNKNPLIDINVRKAIFHSINRERIVDELLGKNGKVLNSLFHEESVYYKPLWTQYDYDLEKARQYLKRAGYDSENPLYLTIGASLDSYARQAIEEIIKEDLDSIGIKIWIANKESKEWYLDYVKNGNYELGLWALHTPDSESLENYFSSEKIPSLETDKNKNCNNFYWYENEEVNTLLDKLINEPFFEVKSGFTEQIQKEIADDAVILPLYSRIFAVAHSDKVQNVEISRTDGSFFRNIIKMDIEGESTPIEIADAETDDTDSGETVSESVEDTDFKSMVVAYEQEPYILNPLVTDNVYRDFINSLIVCGLWKRGNDGEYLPMLVDSVVTGSGELNGKDDLQHTLRATIRLKDNIFWQDCTPITSGDVVATINAILADESLDYADINYKAIKSIEVVDNKEFVVTFNEYDINWKSFFSVIFPENKLVDGNISEIFSEDIFGCGPFKLREWVKGEHIILEKNYCFFDEKPEIDAIKFIFNSDINYLIGMLKEGNVDILSIPADLDLMTEIEENEDLVLLVEQGNLWEHLAICLKPKQD